MKDIFNLAHSLKGKTKKEVIDLCINAGLIPACIREDALNFPITYDLRMDRVIYEVDKGIVTKAIIG
jgi:hypothetical protein